MSAPLTATSLWSSAKGQKTGARRAEANQMGCLGGQGKGKVGRIGEEMLRQLFFSFFSLQLKH